MKYYFPQYTEGKARFLSYTVVASALENAGHTIVDNLDECDAALFSMCDVMEYRDLMRFRKLTYGHPLIVGGSYAFNFWSTILYCDAVWVGEVFDMANCRTLDELINSVHCFVGGDTLPIASQRIEWEQVPIAQVDKNRCYYWGGVGCKNKCRFCFTSWTHAHQCNSSARIKQARSICKKKKIHLMISSNEYDNDPGASTFDMLLRDYIKRPCNANVLRSGIEFATDESRSKNGKPVTFDEMFKALQKAEAEGTRLKWFHITGYDPIEAWYEYIDTLCRMVEQARYKRLLTVEFNNLQYQNYTPLYAERKAIDPAKYSTHEIVNEWTDTLRKSVPHVLVGHPSPFQRAAARMGVELSTTKDQVDFWARMMVKPEKKMTVQQAYDALFDTGVLDTPPLVLKQSTGEIIVHEKWR